VPTRIVASTVAVAGSIRDRLGSPPLSNSEFTTQTDPNAATIPIGSPPTGTRATTSRIGGPDADGDGGGDDVGVMGVDPASPSSPPQAAKAKTHAPRTLRARLARDVDLIRG
jgi:hypothetical protein